MTSGKFRNFWRSSDGLLTIPTLRSISSLPGYLNLQNAKSSLNVRAREVINFVVSQVNACQYCLAAHTAVGQRIGFAPQEILEIRRGHVPFDSRLDALAKLAHNIALERGHADPRLLQAFFDAGWTEANLVDAIVIIGDKTISNYLHATTRIPVDFPAAPALNA